MLKSVNPFTGKLIREFEEYPDFRIEEILNKSADAFEKWKRSEAPVRKELVGKVADLLDSRKDEYAGIITSEMGKPIRESREEIEKCAWVCRYYRDKYEQFLAIEKIETDANSSYVRYDPLGTILGIMPWNFPFWQVFRFLIPTIMAGNTAVLKHASNVQMCAEKIANLFSDAGFPDYVFTNLVLGSSRVEPVIRNEIIKAVSLTGSEAAGKKVAATAAGVLKKSVLELGGSNAFVVLEDANIEKAVEVGIRARFQNAGQSCIAAKRFILHRNIAERFTGMFLEAVSKLKSGDPMMPETEIGPLSSTGQADIVEDQVKLSVKMGARIASGGKRCEAYYEPSVIVGVNPGMPLFDDEVFGPVAPLTVAENTSQAIELSGTTRFGLGMTLFTDDLEKAEKIAEGIKDGSVFINGLVKSDPRLPFGGTGSSGYGRELSHHGIREFVNTKTVWVKKY